MLPHVGVVGNELPDQMAELGTHTIPPAVRSYWRERRLSLLGRRQKSWVASDSEMVASVQGVADDSFHPSEGQSDVPKSSDEGTMLNSAVEIMDKESESDTLTESESDTSTEDVRTARLMVMLMVMEVRMWMAMQTAMEMGMAMPTVRVM